MFAYGICAHSITFFTHDTAGVDAFFDMGFGKCCTDRIRSRDAPFPAIQTPPEVTYAPVPPEEIASIRPLRCTLHRHMAKIPVFFRTRTLRMRPGLPMWSRAVDVPMRRTRTVRQSRIWMWTRAGIRIFPPVPICKIS